MRVRRVLSLSALACALCACPGDEEPATQITISVNSNMAPETEVARIRVQVERANGGGASDPHVFKIASGTPSGDEVNLPFSLGVTKGSQSRIAVIVTAIGPDDEEIVERRELATFQDGKTLLLPVFLASICIGVECPGGETCQQDDGVCDATREPTLRTLKPGDEDEIWDEGSSGSGGDGDGDGDITGDGDGDGDITGDGDGDGDIGDGDGDGDIGDGDGDGDIGDGDGDGDITCSAGDLVYAYADADADSYGDPSTETAVCITDLPSDWVLVPGDCCDIDYFTNPESTGDVVQNACGSFDYDCDTDVEKSWDGEWSGDPFSDCCAFPFGDGWDGPTPACGEEEVFFACDFGSCLVVSGSIPQVCF